MNVEGNSGPSGRWRWLVLAITVALGLALRFWRLDVPGLWWDEMVTLIRAALPIADIWRALSFQAPSDAQVDLFPPLYHIVLRLLTGPEPSAVHAKMLSAAFGVLTIPAMYLLGSWAFGRRAGLLAAGLLALNLFQIHYSREARPYTLFELLSCLSMAFFLAGIERGKARDWICHVLASSLLCYSSYMAVSCLAAQGLVLIGWTALGLASGPEGRRRILMTARDACVSFAVVGLAYLPWLPAHVFNFALIQNPSAVKSFDVAMLARFVEIMFAHEYYGHWAVAPFVLALAVGGAWASWRGGRKTGVALLGIWAALPVILSIAVKTQMDIQPRYFFSVQLALMLLAGKGADWLGERAAALPGLAKGRAVVLVRPCVGGLVVLALSLPMMVSYPRYTRKESSGYRLAALTLAENGAGLKVAAFQSGAQRAVLRPLLGRDFDFLDRFEGGSAQRAWYVAQENTRLPEGAVFWASTGNLETSSTVFKTRFVNRSPLWLTPKGYSDGFDGFSVYADCLRLENMAPKPEVSHLGLLDPHQPGEAVYHVMTGPDATVRLTLKLGAVPHYAGWPDGSIIVSAGAADGVWRVLATLDASAFLADGAPAVPSKERREYSLVRELEVPPDVLASGGFFLSIRLLPGTRAGLLELAGLHLDMAGAPRDAIGPDPGNVLKYLDQIVGRTPIVPWREDAPLYGSGALHGFALNEALAGARSFLGGQELLARFRAAHPGLAPVLVLMDEAGCPAIELYDPALADPFLHVPDSGESRRTLDHAPFAPLGVGLWGPLERPVVEVDGKEVSLPVSIPEGTAVYLNPGGEGRLVFTPDFSLPAGEVSARAHSSAVLASMPQEPGITCGGDMPCFAVYCFESDFPVTWLSLTYVASLNEDSGRSNWVRAAYSTDGLRYLPLDEVRSTGLFSMHGRGMRTGRAKTAIPARRVYLRLELSGDGAGIISVPDRPLRLEMGLDCAGFMPPPLAHAEFALRPIAGVREGVRLYYSKRPWNFFDRLKRLD